MSDAAELHDNIPEWSLGDRLRKARRDAGYEPREFVRALREHGVKKSESTVNAWENDTNRPMPLLDVIHVYEAITSVPASWLLGLGPQKAKKVRLLSGERGQMELSIGSHVPRLAVIGCGQ